MRALLDAQADVDAPTERGATPPFAAARAAAALARTPSTPLAGATALFIAAERGRAHVRRAAHRPARAARAARAARHAPAVVRV